MPRKLPDCAFCGKPLKGHGRIALCFEDIPGVPYVGWHAGVEESCYSQDETDLRLGTQDRPATMAEIRKIIARGASRVTVGSRWPG